MRAELADLGIAFRRMALWGAGAFYLYVGWWVWRLGAGQDSYAYWLAWHRHSMYSIAPSHFGAFLYSPVFAQIIWPLTRFPWPVFFWVWTVAGFAVFAWLLWPLHWRHRIPALCFCVPQVIDGNVWPLFAVVILFGFRRPALWAIPLLVKITSAMCLVWFDARREWHLLARAVAAAALLTGVSAAISPHLWAEWIHLLIHGGSVATPAFTGGLNIPLRLRLPVAVGLAVYGARKDRVGFLAAAVAIGSPVFNAGLTLSTFSVFAALPRLHGRRPKTVAATQPRPLMSPQLERAQT